VPPFHPPAGVIVWGERIFTRYQAGEYREAFAYHCPPGAGLTPPAKPIVEPAPVPPVARANAEGFDREAT